MGQEEVGASRARRCMLLTSLYGRMENVLYTFSMRPCTFSIRHKLHTFHAAYSHSTRSLVGFSSSASFVHSLGACVAVPHSVGLSAPRCPWMCRRVTVQNPPCVRYRLVSP